MQPAPPGRLTRGVLLAAIVGLAVVNGMVFAPLFDSVAYFLLPVSKEFFVASRTTIYHATSPVIALATLVLGGVPAAIYERIGGHERSTAVSLGIWLLAVLALSLPGLLDALDLPQA
jgi:ABC-type transport system involved in multi-copper enzyme maturation permease subunit